MPLGDADITELICDVRFTLKNGHVQCIQPCLLWANSGHAGATNSLVSSGINQKLGRKYAKPSKNKQQSN
jgi:hypothetical protein